MTTILILIRCNILSSPSSLNMLYLADLKIRTSLVIPVQGGILSNFKRKKSATQFENNVKLKLFTCMYCKFSNTAAPCKMML